MAEERFDKVVMESPEEGTKELTREQFWALPIGKRVDLLCKGQFKFFKGAQAVSAIEALKS